MASSRARAAAKTPKAAARSVLPIQFAEDALTRVSRTTLKALAKKLGFNETQTVHYALAYLKREVESGQASRKQEDDEYPRLTERQIAAVRRHQPKRARPGVVVDSLIR